MSFCLQEKFASKSICFGCGPANAHGLRIRSMVTPTEPDRSTAHWNAQRYHEAFPGMLNGGIIGALLDCHSNWTAAWYLMNLNHLEQPPCTVTAHYAIQLKRPTPTDGLITLTARVLRSPGRSSEDRATIEAELSAGGKLCATCLGTFVAVKPGHPAYHRW